MKRFFIFFSFLLLATACSPLQNSQRLSLRSEGFISLSQNEELNLEEAKTDYAISYKPFPSEDNQYIRYWIEYFTGSGKSNMASLLKRSTRYIPIMKSIFKSEGLPVDLVYMVMAESGFSSHARSSDNAVGYWQFLKDTARDYDLKVNYYVDERQDFVLSTKAAIRYLKYLYLFFGDWRLSMAGYNSGEGTVLSAIREQGGNRNYWLLVEKQLLPKETRDYVPKVMAMRKIANNPELYGFSDLEYQESLDYKVISLSSSSLLSTLSNELNIPYEALKTLNPKFKKDIIPFNKEENYVRIPIGY